MKKGSGDGLRTEYRIQKTELGPQSGRGVPSLVRGRGEWSPLPLGGTPNYNERMVFGTGVVGRRLAGACGAICPTSEILATGSGFPEELDRRRKKYIHGAGLLSSLTIVLRRRFFRIVFYPGLLHFFCAFCASLRLNCLGRIACETSKLIYAELRESGIPEFRSWKYEPFPFYLNPYSRLASE